MKDETRSALSSVGMTEAEIDAMASTVILANQLLDLPVLHAADKSEVCHAIHIVQDKLMARPAMRAMKRGQ